MAGDPLAVVDVTACTVVFHMTDKAGRVVVNAAGAVISGPAGTVRYVWLPADTLVAGEFRGEFQLTFPDTKIRTFPNPGVISITISGQLA
jgi:hypothetical protein